MTSEKRKGDKFEVWTESLLRDLGYHQVRRNVLYHRARYDFRQVDLEYFNILSPFESFVILETKWLKSGKLPLKFRGTKKKSKNKQRIKVIDNVVVELEERRRFVRADTAVLVTNQYFRSDVLQEAERYGIKTWDRDALTRMDKKGRWISRLLWTPDPLDKQIQEVRLRSYNLNPTRVYI